MAKRVLRLYSAGGYQKNAADLDRLSRQGQRLEKPGILFCELESDAQVRRYQLDYCPSALGDEEPARRLAAFTRAGWELVGVTHTGWRYFSKAAAENQPESDYENPLPRTRAEERKIGRISLFFWLRVPVVLAGGVLAVLAMVWGKSLFVPALLFLGTILLLSLQIQRLQTQLRP